MSKNEEKERKNSKGQKKNNKLTKGNKTPGKDNKSPLREEGKPDDISNAFPNFSALTEDERLAFFEALTTARKNVEKRGVRTRQCFGTVHDEYLKYYNQDEEEGKKNFCISVNSKETPSLKSSLTIHDGNASSCSDQSTLKLYNRNPSDGGPRLPTPLFAETPHKGLFPVIKDKRSWEQCESVIKQNTSQMVDIYLRKKKRNEAKADGVQLVNKKIEKNIKKENEKASPEMGKKRKENARMGSVAKTVPKVRNTPKFNALTTEEKDIFFRTLKEARENMVKRKPEKNMEILPLSVIMRKYRGDREASSVFTTAQELRKGEEGRKNLRVKVTLTSGDNERLSRTKSQVFSEAVREASDRRHKSADSLHAEGKEPSGKNEIQSETSNWNLEKISKLSKESLENNTSTLKNGKETKTTVQKKQEKNTKETVKPQVKKKKKFLGKQEKLIPPTSSLVVIEPKITDSMKVNISDSSLRNEKKVVKALKKEAGLLGKKRTKNEKQKKKKVRKKEEKEPNAGSFFPCEVAENREVENKGSDHWKSATEQCDAKSKEECEIRETKEMQENGDEEIYVIEINPDSATDKKKGEEDSLESEKEVVAQEKRNDEENSCKEEQSLQCEPECPELQNEFPVPELQNEFPVPELRTEFPVPELQNEFPVPELQTEFPVPELQTEFPVPELQNEFPVPEVQNEFPVPEQEATEVDVAVEEEEEAPMDDGKMDSGSLKSILTEIAHSVSNISLISENLEEVRFAVLDDGKECEEEKGKEDHLIGANLKEITVEASEPREIFKGANFLKGTPGKEEKTTETATETASGKVMLVDDDVVENIRKLIFYLEAKVQKDGHLEKEYLQLVVDYVDYLSKILESLVLREERNHKQVHDTYMAAEVHLKFKDGSSEGESKQKTESKREFFPRSISDQDFRNKYAAKKTKQQTLKEKSSEEKPEDTAHLLLDSESSTDSEVETHFTPIYSDEKKILSTKIRLLQDLLKQRAEFVEGSIEDFKIVHHPEADDLVPIEKPPTVQVLTDEDEENMQQDNKKKFFKTLLRCCACGKKKTEEDGIFENLKGEAIRVEMYEEKKIDPASATLNQSTMEVLKATERKKIIEKYYSQD